MPRVVIVGAGFGGLQAARRLARAPVHVTVIDRNNYHLFQPLLYQVATAALSPADIATPIRAVSVPPVPLPRRGDHGVACPEGSHRSAPVVLDAAEPVGHVEDLADGVQVPSGPRTGCEVHFEDAESILVIRVGEVIHPDLTSEKIRVTGARCAGLWVVDLHGTPSLF